MPLEIERKFLVSGDFKSFVTSKERITQAYICDNPDRSVRVRRKGEKAYLTIKGSSNEKGISRFEWEKEISVEDAEELFSIWESGMIDKIRNYVRCGKHTYEIDEFLGENEGLIVAEIELEDESETFYKPEWLGKEVTGDKRYYNLSLSKNPYNKWEEEDDKNQSQNTR